MYPQDRREPHQIVWDEPSLEHSTWQGPPAFDFSQAPPAQENFAAYEPEQAAAPGDFHQTGAESPAVNAAEEAPSFNEPAWLDEPAPETPSDEHSEAAPSPAPLSSPDDDGEQPRADEGLPEDSLTIGRSRSNGIVLDDMLVSRRHVVITADEEGLLLRDLDSRNGTFVNGRKVEQTHLHEGDRIGIGASTFEVRDGWLVAV